MDIGSWITLTFQCIGLLVLAITSLKPSVADSVSVTITAAVEAVIDLSVVEVSSVTDQVAVTDQAQVFLAAAEESQLAKQIIILSNTKGPGGDQDVTALFWFPVTANQQIPQASATSMWRGASQAEMTAIRAGTVYEQVYRSQYPAGFSLAQIQSALVTAYGVANTAFQALPNPNQYYGASYDGASWAAAPALPPGNVAPLAFGALTISSSGDNTVIAGAAGQSIAIVQMTLGAAGAATVLVKDGASTVMAGYTMVAGTPLVLPATEFPWFVTSAGNNFVLNLSSAVSVVISGWYRQA